MRTRRYHMGLLFFRRMPLYWRATIACESTQMAAFSKTGLASADARQHARHAQQRH